MKDFISKPANFSKIEFWAVTTVYVFVLFFLISDHLSGSWNLAENPGSQVGPFQYDFVARLIRYTVLYLAFLVLNFKIVPLLIRKEALFLNILSVLLIFFTIGFLFGVTDTYLKYQMLPGQTANRTMQNLLLQSRYLYATRLLLLFGFYSVVKYVGLYILSHTETIQSRYRMVTPGSLVAFVVWMILLFFITTSGAEVVVISGFAVIPPATILLYAYCLHTLIPKALQKRKPFRAYMLRICLVLVLSFIPVLLAGALFAQHGDAGLAIAFMYLCIQLLLTAPISWFIYKRQMAGEEELYMLKRELGQSTANFDFLRSQINPHFLFNALNTIYGTALQEGAERTSEGIEKLGDMMRFMLQENMQEKIPLSREIDYLNNYIGLQRLRTNGNPVVQIDAAIEQQVFPYQVAPMLLIPFVENAFKHGISLRETSHIKITLEIKERTLYFDVFNNKHPHHEADPEKSKSGIGLTNVKQRLKLMYNGKHELIIRETTKDFFIHLTIQL